MGEARKYTSGTHAALMSLCRGFCYWPGCDEPVTRFVDGEHILNLEIAHIRAVSSGGKRFDPQLSLDEKNAFSNLLLLCKVHHVRVDGHGSEQYTVELLQTWKEQRESDGTAPLLELQGLTEERLRELVSESFAAFQDETHEALAELARIAPEAAATLRVLVEELRDPRVHGFGIDPDVASWLRSASDGLGHLQDTAPLLWNVARDLRHLQDSASLLRSAADSLRGTADTARALQDGANQLMNAEGLIMQLNQAATELRRARGGY
ncbi:HNH endonuclease signature motif containing protein [Streptomyces virginiae]|uniref:HNH endonuclease signature motif containing protein n=1 Tax=Streptomyces virginiae TaxID=1961 RepID=UPI00324DC2B7